MARRFVGVVVGISLVAASCAGGSSMPAEERDLIDEMVSAWTAQPPEGGPAWLFGEAETRCWAEALLGARGVDAVRAAGFGADGFASVGEAEAALAALVDALTDETTVIYMESAMGCIGPGEVLASQMIADGVPEVGARCLGDRMAEADGFVEWMVALMLETGEDEAGEREMMAVYMEALTVCFTPDELTDLMPGWSG